MQFNLVLKPCKAVLTLLLQREPLAFLKTWSIAAYPGGREDTKSEPWVLRKSNEINLGRSLSGQKGMGKTNPQPLTKNLDSSDVPRTFLSHFWISPLPSEKLWRGQGSPLEKHVQWLTCVFCVPVGRERHRLLRPKRSRCSGGAASLAWNVVKAAAIPKPWYSSPLPMNRGEKENTHTHKEREPFTCPARPTDIPTSQRYQAKQALVWLSWLPAK